MTYKVNVNYAQLELQALVVQAEYIARLEAEGAQHFVHDEWVSPTGRSTDSEHHNR